MRLGRACPDLNAELLFDRDEWQGAFILNKKKPPQMPPTLNEVLRLVAKLGGFLARKGDGEPGVKTILAGFTAGDALCCWPQLCAADSSSVICV